MNKHRRLFALASVSLLFVAIFATAARSEEPNANCNDRNIRAGRTVIVPANCRVHGDVYVGAPGSVVNEETFRLGPDNDGETGMIVDCVRACKVFFKFGGGITGQLVQSISRDMARTGCGGGCAHGAHTLVWPHSARADDSSI